MREDELSRLEFVRSQALLRQIWLHTDGAPGGPEEDVVEPD